MALIPNELYWKEKKKYYIRLKDKLDSFNECGKIAVNW